MGLGAFLDVPLYELPFEIVYELAVSDAILWFASVSTDIEIVGMYKVRTGERTSCCSGLCSGSMGCLV